MGAVLTEARSGTLVYRSPSMNPARTLPALASWLLPITAVAGVKLGWHGRARMESRVKVPCEEVKVSDVEEDE
ncbi:MAG: hypothetical protein WD342_01615 [Verrucomicrobiales bacterium]